MNRRKQENRKLIVIDPNLVRNPEGFTAWKPEEGVDRINVVPCVVGSVSRSVQGPYSFHRIPDLQGKPEDYCCTLKKISETLAGEPR